jgi:hypothetical protein
LLGTSVAGFVWRVRTGKARNGEDEFGNRPNGPTGLLKAVSIRGRQDLDRWLRVPPLV